MPGTIDDFMNRFGGSGTIDDSEAQQYHDRFVSTNANDRDFDNQTYNKSATEYLGKLPDDQFQDAARSAYNQAAPQERQGLLGGLLAALGSGVAGGGMGDIANKLGLGTTDPSRMSADDAARLMNYTRSERPELLQKDCRRKALVCESNGQPSDHGRARYGRDETHQRSTPKNRRRRKILKAATDCCRWLHVHVQSRNSRRCRRFCRSRPLIERAVCVGPRLQP